jgi:hypothetical protein
VTLQPHHRQCDDTLSFSQQNPPEGSAEVKPFIIKKSKKPVAETPRLQHEVLKEQQKQQAHGGGAEAVGASAELQEQEQQKQQAHGGGWSPSKGRKNHRDEGGWALLFIRTDEMSQTQRVAGTRCRTHQKRQMVSRPSGCEDTADMRVINTRAARSGPGRPASQHARSGQARTPSHTHTQHAQPHEHPATSTLRANTHAQPHAHQPARSRLWP